MRPPSLIIPWSKQGSATPPSSMVGGSVFDDFDGEYRASSTFNRSGCGRRPEVYSPSIYSQLGTTRPSSRMHEAQPYDHEPPLRSIPAQYSDQHHQNRHERPQSINRPAKQEEYIPPRSLWKKDPELESLPKWERDSTQLVENKTQHQQRIEEEERLFEYEKRDTAFYQHYEDPDLFPEFTGRK
jgi:hypothetical protein